MLTPPLIQELRDEIKFRKQQLELARKPSHVIALMIQLEDLERNLKFALGEPLNTVKDVKRIHHKRNLF
jgi:hypothetical protein